MKNILLPVCFLLLLSACGGGDDMDAAESPSGAENPGGEEAPDNLAAYESLKNEWPLTVKEGYAGCDGLALYFLHKGKKYALNRVAAARTGQYHPLRPIWADPEPVWGQDPYTGRRTNLVSGTKKSITPLLKLAEEKC